MLDLGRARANSRAITPNRGKSCHEKIDPLGFSLDRYDANGRFLQPGKNSIDTSGKMPDGATFGNFAELKEILLTSQREKIVRNCVERTLSYALCRKLVRTDQPTVDHITRTIAGNNGTWRDLFTEVALSVQFRETIIEAKKKS